MTRTSLNRTLRRAYAGLFLVLGVSLAAKFADRIPGIAGTPIEAAANDIYEYLKDMALVFVTVVAAYLANVFQKRSKFVESLEEEWRGIVRTKSALFTYCEKTYVSTDDYLAAFCRISETIDNMRIVYANAGETATLVGLYPLCAAARHAPRAAVHRSPQAAGPSAGGPQGCSRRDPAVVLRPARNLSRGARSRRAGASAADFEGTEAQTARRDTAGALSPSSPGKAPGCRTARKT